MSSLRKTCRCGKPLATFSQTRVCSDCRRAMQAVRDAIEESRRRAEGEKPKPRLTVVREREEQA